MKRKELLNEVIKRIKQNEYSYRIKKYLASKGITEDKQEEILAEAKKIIKEEKLRKLPLQNKVAFSIFLFLAIVTFIYFVFILPNSNIYSSTAFYAIIGVLLFVTFGTLVLLYNKRWTPESIEREVEGKIKPDYGVVLFLAVFPCIILYFLLMWRYSSTEAAILKETQVRTVGTITSGISTQSSLVNSTTVIVEFLTLDGNLKTVKEDISSTEFRKFYLGQKVDMVYSSKFPSIIELLTNSKEIKQYTNSAERDISAKDLMAILTKEFIPNEEALNKISLGWKYDKTSKVWANEGRYQFINIREYGQVIYVTDLLTSYEFVKDLHALGFKKQTEAKDEKGFDKFNRQNRQNRVEGIGLYENEKFILEITRKVNNNKFFALITIVEKLGS